MLYIRTGLQGHGKTLNTIKEVDQAAKTQDRPVYFHNVTDLDPAKLQASWYPFDDPLLWYELPDNCMVVIDEAQGWFGLRDPRQPVPLHISRFEVMRKQGHEVHLITQDPRFIDVHARRLCNKHIHYWRLFGSAKLARYESERCVNEVEKLAHNKDVDKKVISLDKRYFGVYTSAKAGHHFKFNPSKKLILAICAVPVVGYLVYDVYALINKPAAEAQAATSTPAASSGSVVSDAVEAATSAFPSSALKKKGDKGDVLSTDDYLALRVPRIPLVPSSAPIFDEVAKPVAYPRLTCISRTGAAQGGRDPSASMRLNGRPLSCSCYSQQGTRYETTLRFCLDTARNGVFDPGQQPGSFMGQSSLPSVNQTPDISAAMPSASSVVTVVSDSEYSARPWRK
ncbi:zonular occludens toxin [Pseudomonas sp. ABC1]|uniref:zonular occludens toxin domain-containing protein n=1 Tax=Pseudomonas sp. ABC1 TaxID=2748080 RepID=UPI0015C3C3E8|nr:zonular occludens toxin domain-containing protein [Pseudomonas sp. ABC1]QLF94097.1 zonular occludens toxin [Pseudomonas sp. ABC1]